MPLRLRDDLTFCLCAGRAIFLDLAADRYFCLDGDLEAAFGRWAAGEGAGECRLGIEILLECGLLVRDSAPSGGGGAASLPRATHDLLEGVPTAPAVGDIAAALLAELAVAARLRFRPLIEIVRSRRAGSRRARPPANQDREARKVAAAFARTGLVLGTADRCLARALALTVMAQRRGLSPALVFGVRINPFAAHCWVQIGDAVLVGDFEQVRLFTPILVVR